MLIKTTLFSTLTFLFASNATLFFSFPRYVFILRSVFVVIDSFSSTNETQDVPACFWVAPRTAKMGPLLPFSWVESGTQTSRFRHSANGHSAKSGSDELFLSCCFPPLFKEDLVIETSPGQLYATLLLAN